MFRLSGKKRNLEKKTKRKSSRQKKTKWGIQTERGKMKRAQNKNGTIDVLVGYKSNLSEWALHLTSKRHFVFSVPDSIIMFSDWQCYWSLAFSSALGGVEVKMFLLGSLVAESGCSLTCIELIGMNPETSVCVTCVFAVSREQSVTAAASPQRV